MPRRAIAEQVEAIMVPKIVAAIYPVLIPIEQQDCAIQARNLEQITEIATMVWREYAGPRSR